MLWGVALLRGLLGPFESTLAVEVLAGSGDLGLEWTLEGPRVLECASGASRGRSHTDLASLALLLRDENMLWSMVLPLELLGSFEPFLVLEARVVAKLLGSTVLLRGLLGPFEFILVVELCVVVRAAVAGCARWRGRRDRSSL
jgi:hypothetical protein